VKHHAETEDTHDAEKLVSIFEPTTEITNTYCSTGRQSGSFSFLTPHAGGRSNPKTNFAQERRLAWLS
jgi:hypothetical protein